MKTPKQPIKKGTIINRAANDESKTATVQHSFEFHGHVFAICKYEYTYMNSDRISEGTRVLHYASGMSLPFHLAKMSLSKTQEFITDQLTSLINRIGKDEFEKSLAAVPVINTATTNDTELIAVKNRLKETADLLERTQREKLVSDNELQGVRALLNLSKEEREEELEREIDGLKTELAHAEQDNEKVAGLNSRIEDLENDLEFAESQFLYQNPTLEEQQKVEILRDMAHNASLRELEVMEHILIALRGGYQNYVSSDDRTVTHPSNIDKATMNKVAQAAADSSTLYHIHFIHP
jgi:hypothetical protein